MEMGCCVIRVWIMSAAVLCGMMAAPAEARTHRHARHRHAVRHYHRTVRRPAPPYYAGGAGYGGTLIPAHDGTTDLPMLLRACRTGDGSACFVSAALSRP